MRRVLLGATGIETSALGFGTAQLGPRLGRRLRRRLLDTAFESGITHFDTAPIYGYGHAERALGEFLRRRRGDVTVTTKLGLGLRPAPLLRRAAGRQPFEPARDVPALRRSFEDSLRRLRTSSVDILLLHEWPPDRVPPEVIAFLDELVAGGRARVTGVAGRIERPLAPHGFPDVVQLAHADLGAAGPLGDRGVITHSALSAGIDLERAAAENRGGIVLFSTRRPERIREAADRVATIPRTAGP